MTVSGMDRGWPREEFCKGYCLSRSFKNEQENSGQDVDGIKLIL